MGPREIEQCIEYFTGEHCNATSFDGSPKLLALIAPAKAVLQAKLNAAQIVDANNFLMNQLSSRRRRSIDVRRGPPAQGRWQRVDRQRCDADKFADSIRDHHVADCEYRKSLANFRDGKNPVRPRHARQLEQKVVGTSNDWIRPYPDDLSFSGRQRDRCWRPWKSHA
ncbi:MAG: hypothetical protein FJX06_15405 [Alphaproteobacteria bacterium]|nr:hypothetical protein [Alphaproteobacteria bacterium]